VPGKDACGSKSSQHSEVSKATAKSEVQFLVQELTRARREQRWGQHGAAREAGRGVGVATAAAGRRAQARALGRGAVVVVGERTATEQPGEGEGSWTPGWGRRGTEA